MFIERKGKCSAIAIYSEGKVKVKSGSTINMSPSSSARGKLIKEYRSDNKVVSQDGILLKDCVFPSVSAAARFVTGRSENGFTAWRVETISLGEWLESNGLREKKQRYKGRKVE